MTTILLEEIKAFKTEYEGNNKTLILEDVMASNEYAASISWKKFEEANKLVKEHVGKLDAAVIALDCALAPSYPRLKDAIENSYSGFPAHETFGFSRQFLALNAMVSAERSVSAARMHFDPEFVTQIQSLFMAQTEAETQLKQSIASNIKAEEEAQAFLCREPKIEEAIRNTARFLRRMITNQKP